MHHPNNEYALDNPVLDPVAQSFLDQLAAAGGKPIYELPVTDARNVLEGAQSQPAPKPAADVTDIAIPVGPSGSVSLRIVKPKGAQNALPSVLYFHGGGWVLGSPSTHDRLIHELAVGGQAAVVFVDYSRSPEAQYPFAVDEGYAAMQWVARNGADIGVNGSEMIVAGDSAGGNIAIATLLTALDRGGPGVAALVLFYPVTDANFETVSYRQFASGHFLEREGMKWFWDQYVPAEADRQSPTASPLRASVNHLQGLPPTLVITGECDVLRDEGEAFARKLTMAGVRTTAVRFIGAIHDFVMLNAVAATPAARGAIALANDYIRTTFAERKALRIDQ